MSPLQIEMLLHFHYSTQAFVYSEASKEAMYGFLHVSRLVEQEGDGYSLTDRGDAYVNALCEMPLPVCVWVIPEMEG